MSGGSSPLLRYLAMSSIHVGCIVVWKMLVLVTSILGLSKNSIGIFQTAMKSKVEDKFAKTLACLFSSWGIYWILKSLIFITKAFTSTRYATI
ncbi:hypothetical protein Acr_17g0007170 [Actinidia rufa]|uniref:Uncharacterized protein n=1 Tax=Actinidia rufa TaxID=165716 RepID=A0A7J0G2Y0_9ERIC|nr:hypothetical protein Acr_17g0007170 [Actinidia rufa]